MIFGRKTDVQKHFSSKHSMFSQKLFVDETPATPTGQGPGGGQASPQPQPEKIEMPNVAPPKP